MSTDTISASPATDATVDAFADKRHDLHQRFLHVGLSDTSLSDEIPNGAVLILLPDDGDAAFAAAEIELGLLHLRLGQDVFFRHLKLSELPQSPPPSGHPTPGGRRTFFNWDGSISSQEVAGPDGTWVPAEPSQENGR